MAKLEDRLATLAKMQRSDLQTEWARVCGQAAPNLSGDLLRLGIAYRLQEKAHGGLPRRAMAELKVTGSARRTVKPGTRFVRSWNGRTISVQAEEHGFLFEDRCYASLSAIAREVTGSNWSGPRFFGLRGKTADG